MYVILGDLASYHSVTGGCISEAFPPAYSGPHQDRYLFPGVATLARVIDTLLHREQPRNNGPRNYIRTSQAVGWRKDRIRQTPRAGV